MWLQFLTTMDSFRKKIKNDLFFFVFGLFLPANILFYRIVCKLFFSSFVFVNSAVFDTVFFCYFPTFLLFLLLYKKDSNFFMKKFEYLKWILTLYSLAAKVHCYFYEKIMVFFCFLFLYFSAYLLLSYTGSLFEIPFLILRQFIVSYCAFNCFFTEEAENPESVYIDRFSKYSFFDSFLVSFISLKSERKQMSSQLSCSANTFVFLCLSRQNRIVKYYMAEYSIIAEKLLSSLQGKMPKEQYRLLCLEKNNLFTFPERPPFFYFVTHQAWKNILQESDLFCSKLNHLSLCGSKITFS